MGDQVGRDVVPGFGDKIREARETKGWSQPQLAERASTHFTTISKIEKGERSASLQLALRLAEALGLSITKLIPADWKERMEAGEGKADSPAPPAPAPAPKRKEKKP